MIVDLSVTTRNQLVLVLTPQNKIEHAFLAMITENHSPIDSEHDETTGVTTLSTFDDVPVKRIADQSEPVESREDYLQRVVIDAARKLVSKDELMIDTADLREAIADLDDDRLPF